MTADPVGLVRELLARQGIAASEDEVQRTAVMVSLRRSLEPGRETEPHLVQHVVPWKPS